MIEKPSSASDLLAMVIQSYRANGSLMQTAADSGLSTVKVRKLLITAGQWQSPLSERIGALRASGLSTTAIADELQVSIKMVTAYLPYEKGIYMHPDRTKAAARSERYRMRNNLAAARVVRRIESGDKTMVNRSTTRSRTAAEAKPPVRLHLELSSVYADVKDMKILKKYGESSNGRSITRDILVPADMPLHALHYAIQRLYGWQNSHLRSFRLPRDVFSAMTSDAVRGWFQLIGILFQYSTDEKDQFWDDDYESGSIKSWLRRKYTGPYEYRGSSEHYAAGQQAVQALIDHIPVIEVRAPFDRHKPVKLREAPLVDLTLSELSDSIILETMPNTLQERLLITDLLAPIGQQPADRKDFFAYIKPWVAAGTGQPEGLPIGRSVASFTPDPPIIPITDKLLYAYDFGDGWEIEVTRQNDCDDLLKAGRLTAEDLASAERTVISKHRPVCVALDGINVVDDVGGLAGFVDFLKTIHEGKNAEEREDMLKWARSLGWNTRRVAMNDVL